MAMPGRTIAILSIYVILSILVACGNDDGDKHPETVNPLPGDPMGESTKETVITKGSTSDQSGPADDVVITIGNFTDVTGVSANAMAVMDMALEDLVRYFNEENLIPGVELEVIMYDEQSDPSRDIPGYEWLKEKGVDLFFTGLGSVAQSLASRLEEDKMVLFTVDANEEELSPPGYIFCLSNLPEETGYTVLNWIAENDWDYQVKGPAKVGGAGWFFPYVESLLGGMEEYCDVHSDQFEWMGEYLNPVGTFTWGPEAEALRNCDYVVPPIAMTNFVKEYRDAGYAAKLIGTDAQAAFLGIIGDARLWDEIDGMLFLRTPRWWNEEGTMIDLTKKLLYDNNPDSSEMIIRSGNSYLVVNQLYPMLQIIANAIEAVGPQGYSSQALYDAAESFTLTIDDITFSFNDTKRTAVDYLAMYKAVGAEKDLFRVEPEWYPIVRQP